MTTPWERVAAMTYEERVAYYLKGLKYINTGPAPGCAECLECDNPDDPGEEWYDLAGEGSFSRWPCDSCGSTLGGDRFPAHAFFEDDPDRMLHLDICTDCVSYHACGDVPEEVGN